MSIETFHIHLYGPDPLDRPSVPGQTTPLPTSFEAAQQRLRTCLPNVLLEPDGSLAWAGKDHQIVGMIYDAATMIQYVELRGRCDRIRLREFVETLAGSKQIDQFATMILPERQWKIFHSFERSLPSSPTDPRG
jgi:hypothetical protein